MSYIPENVIDAFKQADKFFPTEIQKFQFFDKYSRFNYRKKRRETWIETVDRATKYLVELSQNKLDKKDYDRIREFIINMKATPSMRLLAMAGDAAKRQNIAIYNCSYLPVDSIDSFVEALIVSMAGCGVGYSVEKQYVNNLPKVNYRISEQLPYHFIISDSTEGWTDALRKCLEYSFAGKDIIFDYSLIRPAGAPLKVKGGRASGPQPLKDLLNFIIKKIREREGKKLRPIDAHDIMCMVGQAAVSGGVRRTALISIFDWDDEEMINCKNGDNIIGNEQRWNANNSAVWSGDLKDEQLRKQMLDMVDGQRGEPGIFNREAANKLKPDRRKEAMFGTNPCGEINLRPYEFCNLSIAIARPNDTLETLKEKVEVATIIGTIQSMATNFPGLREIWKKNCEEERLLGVDITGQLDCKIVQQKETMETLRDHAVNTNKIYAQKLGIPQSASVTCVKPSGNSSQLFDCSSGLHARWSQYYIRNIRVNAHVPLFRILKEAGVPMDPENGQTVENASSWVIHFPVKSPDGSITRKNRGALEQLRYWLMNKRYWTEHNPSCTISYEPQEVDEMINWVIRHRNMIGGLSFLPKDNAKYDQMPYEEITEEEYNKRLVKFPKIDFSKLYDYEKSDFTTSSMELACVGKDSCELDFTDLPGMHTS